MYGKDCRLYNIRIGVVRGGAGDDDDNDGDEDRFRIRHPANSDIDQDRESLEVLELEQEIRRLNLLMAKAQKLPEGDQSNRDIFAQLQRMIDQLERERDAAKNSKATSDLNRAQDGPGLRGGAAQEQDVNLYERTLRHNLNDSPTPPLPPRNPAREERRTQVTAHLQDDSDQRLNEHSELNKVIDLITRIDESRAVIEPLILLQFAYLKLNDRANVPYKIIALIIKLDRVLAMRQELWRQAKVLAWADDEAMQTVRGYTTIATTSVNAFRSWRPRPHTTEANLRGGGSDQPMTEEVDDIESDLPGFLSSNAAPPVPARNPARIHVGAVASDRSELDREIATLGRDLLRASQELLARASQVMTATDLAGPEVDRIERLAVRVRESQNHRTQDVPSLSSPSTRGNSSIGTDAETQAARSAIQRILASVLHAAGTKAPKNRDIDMQAPGFRPPGPQASSPPAPAHPPYRILNCQDWTWPHPNWQFDNLSPSQKISLLRERSSWLARQRDIQEERRAIDMEISRLRSILSLGSCSATYRNPVTPGYDGLGNPIGGYLARRYSRTLGSR